MYKVLIVDDEPLARRHIIKLIDWNKIDMVVCSEAEDGDDAKEKILSEKPDVILMDVIMPMADGLTVVEWMDQLEITPKVVIISGSDDYEYMRRSVKLDIVDYVLKPFDIGELETILEAVSKQLTKERYQSVDNRQETIVSYLYNPNHKNEERLSNIYDFRDYNHFKIAVFHVQQSQRLEKVRIKLYRHFCQECNVDVIKLDEHNILILMFDNEQSANLELEKSIGTFMDNAVLNVKGILVAVSAVFFDLPEINERYEALVNLINNAMIMNDSGFIDINMISGGGPVEVYSLSELAQVLTAVHCNDLTMATQGIEKIFEGLKRGKASYNQVKRVTNVLLSFVHADQRSADRLIVEKNSEEVAVQLISLYAKMLQPKRDSDRCKAKLITKKIIELIDEAYQNPDLSIETLSRALNLNESYISRVFKKVTGETINHYITRKRMGRAKELLSMKRYRHSEIATKVGYTDSGYFSRRFKKIVGVSPKEYEMR